MNGAEVLDIGRDAIWLTIQLCAPCLIVGLIVGVAIGLFQALTQIQEATLIYRAEDRRHLHQLLLFAAAYGRAAHRLHAATSPSASRRSEGGGVEHYATVQQVFTGGLESFTRIGAMMRTTMPGLGETPTPIRARMAFAFLMCMVVTPVVAPTLLQGPAVDRGARLPM